MENKQRDYNKIRLKAGLEVHQQLDTGRKLFCHCPTYLRNDPPEIIVHRKLHAVAGESGEVDVAVLHEMEKNRDFIYQGYKDNTCLLDYDECPPYFIDEIALNEALKIALLFNCEIYPISQIMRKTVIDGSNTSGFQRSVLIAHEGYVETSFGKVGIASLALEEDAARIISKDEKKAVFRLDRLGIPLIEIATKPEIHTPEQIKECALKIGEIVRACKVKRGIGTIRQDLNISIRGHGRVEIKGFQEPKMMIETVEKEIARQQDDLKKKKKEGEVRNALPDGKSEFLRPLPGEARMYPETDLLLLKISRDKINALKKELPKLKHEIRDELKKKGVGGELLNLVIENLDEFEVLMHVYNKDANLIAKMIALWPNEFATKLKKDISEIKEIINEAVMEKILEKVSDGKINEGDVKGILFKIASGEKVEDSLKVEKLSEDELEHEISKIVKEKPGLRVNAYMGLVMAKLKGKIDARKAMEILNKLLK